MNQLPPPTTAYKRTGRLSEVSVPRQTLVRLCQALNHGEIQNLIVRNSEPVYEPPLLVLINERLDSDEGPRPEVELTDFALREEVRRLFVRFDELQNVTVARLSVQAGIPHRVVFQSQFPEKAQ